MDLLKEIRCLSKRNEKDVVSHGLSDENIIKFLALDSNLFKAINVAHQNVKKFAMSDDYKFIFEMNSEQDLINKFCEGWCHFYAEDCRNPYWPVGSKGPWIVTFFGSVIHDSGGYGMLGFGHNPDFILNELSKSETHVMANIMTPSIAHYDLIKRIQNEIGRNRSKCPYFKILAMNSGSEVNSVADRIIDIHSGEYLSRNPQIKKVRGLSLEQSFHGRTFRPALYTDSTDSTYRKTKCRAIIEAKEDFALTTPVNNIDRIRQVFKEAQDNQVFIEAMFIEAIMGEGNPGEQITPEFYSECRSLTKEHNCLLLVDSIQAGLRCTGQLSIIDYPGFENVEAPDFEVFSKALNGGQYPFSILCMTESASHFYKYGVYGNTMTGNPRACQIACRVLEEIGGYRENIVNMGIYAKEQFNKLAEKVNANKSSSNDYIITNVSGTGLLYAVHLNPEFFPVVAFDGAENWLRRNGIGVIHGGHNALRFTPHFGVTREEIDLQVEIVNNFIQNFSSIFSPKLTQRVNSAEADLVQMDNSELKKMVKLNGHLFDSKIVNDLLDLVESFKCIAAFSHLKLGSSVGEASEIDVQISPNKTESIEVPIELMEAISALGRERSCLVTLD